MHWILSATQKRKVARLPAFLTKDISASLEFCHLYRGRQQYATPYNLLLHSERIPIAIQHLFPGTRLFLFNPDLLLTFTIQNIEEHVSVIYIFFSSTGHLSLYVVIVGGGRGSKDKSTFSALFWPPCIFLRCILRTLEFFNTEEQPSWGQVFGSSECLRKWLCICRSEESTLEQPGHLQAVDTASWTVFTWTFRFSSFV